MIAQQICIDGHVFDGSKDSFAAMTHKYRRARFALGAENREMRAVLVDRQ